MHGCSSARLELCTPLSQSCGARQEVSTAGAQPCCARLQPSHTVHGWSTAIHCTTEHSHTVHGCSTAIQFTGAHSHAVHGWSSARLQHSHAVHGWSSALQCTDIQCTAGAVHCCSCAPSNMLMLPLNDRSRPDIVITVIIKAVLVSK